LREVESASLLICTVSPRWKMERPRDWCGSFIVVASSSLYGWGDSGSMPRRLALGGASDCQCPVSVLC